MKNSIISFIIASIIFISGCSYHSTYTSSISNSKSDEVVSTSQTNNSSHSYGTEIPTEDLSENESTNHPSNDLSEWIGEYEYLQGYQEYLEFEEKYAGCLSEMYSHRPRVIMHELSIFEENGECSAIYTSQGWLTDHKIRATVKGNNQEIFIVFNSLLDGVYNGGQDIEGILFALKKTETGIVTEWYLKSGDSSFVEEAFQLKQTSNGFE